MMSDAPADPRYGALIEQLAERAQQGLENNETLTEDDVVPLIGRLREAGFEEDHHGRPLHVLVEDRVVTKYPEPAIHRRAELRAILQSIQNAWEGASDLK